MPAYRKLLRDLYAPKLAGLGFDPTAGAYAAESADQRKRRMDLLAIVGGAGRDPAIRARLIAALDAYLAGDAKALDPAFAVPAIAMATEERGLPFAKTIAEAALKPDKLLRPAAFRGIASANDPAVATWFLDEFKDPRMPVMERLMTTPAFLAAPRTRDPRDRLYDRALRRICEGDGRRRDLLGQGRRHVQRAVHQ
jgi:hypothetical protein